jgi:hypothetical protein
VAGHTYRNDLAGISDSDVPFARSGFATGIFLDGHAYRIAVPWAEIFGTSIKDWTENWWTWALQAPAATNPLNDPTGDWSDINNTAPVYFVAGTLFEGTAKRTFTVEAGRPLLIPVLNNIVLEPEDPTVPDPMADANADLDLWEGSVSDLSAVIDGVPVQNLSAYLVRTDFFTPGNPQPGSLLEGVGLPPEDDLYPSRGSGYWLMVEGLTPGEHTISFGGTSMFGPISVTDTILVG